MTLCEFYRNQFENAKKTARHFADDCKHLEQECGLEQGSFEWFKALSEVYFGGAYLQRYLQSGITREQLNDAKERGMVKHKEYTNWEARQLGKTDYYALTAKGLKTLYRAYDWTE